jgi:hypothetical protein
MQNNKIIWGVVAVVAVVVIAWAAGLFGGGTMAPEATAPATTEAPAAPATTEAPAAPATPEAPAAPATTEAPAAPAATPEAPATTTTQ